MPGWQVDYCCVCGTNASMKSNLSFGDVHEHGGAGGVCTLAADVAVVSGQQLTALGRPTPFSLDPGGDQQNI